MIVSDFVNYIDGEGNRHLGIVTAMNKDNTANIFVFDSASVVGNLNDGSNQVTPNGKKNLEPKFCFEIIVDTSLVKTPVKRKSEYDTVDANGQKLTNILGQTVDAMGRLVDNEGYLL